MNYDVTIDRDKYIGGSDIPVIMGISTFKKRFDLLLEKAGLKEDDFTGNQYTEYGHKIEPFIREYVNELYGTNYEPNRVINGDLRFHTDGFDGKSVLEIKSTSHIYETVEEYKVYLVQLLKYMEENNVVYGTLAVYERPEDFDLENVEFDPDRLTVWNINLNSRNFKSMLEEVNVEIDRFRADLERLKNNPLLTEEDFQPDELVTISKNVIALENRMQAFKAIEAEYKAMKQSLFEAMRKYDVKSWETYNGTKITRVDGTEATVEMVKEFDVATFSTDYPDIVERYSRTVEKKKSGRSGYVKITLPKAGK